MNKCDANDRNCVHIAAYHGDVNLEALLPSCSCIDAQVIDDRVIVFSKFENTLDVDMVTQNSYLFVY